MNISRIAVYRPVATLMAALALSFLGVISFREMQIQRLPEVTFPSLYYSAWIEDSDLSPDETNDLLTRPIEKFVGSLPGVREMRSSTYSGRVWGYVTFEPDTDTRFRVIELQDNLNRWAGDQSQRVYTRITPFSTEDTQGQLMDLILSVPPGQEFRIAAIADMINRKIRSIDGIADVQIAGKMAPNYVLESERDELMANGLTAGALRDAINQRAIDKSLAGFVREGRDELPVYVQSKIQTIDELMKVPVDSLGVFDLETVANLRAEVEKGESVYRINGKKAVRISISKEKDRNAIQMANAVKKRLAEVEAALPAGFELKTTQDEAGELSKMIRNLAKLAVIGAGLAMLVLLVFLRSWRMALVVAVSIPAAILITFNLMYGFGLTVNMITLLGLAAAVGMLVDNSIVVVENVFRHSQKGVDKREAAWLGSREVSRAIVISTATTLAAFIPLMFMDDMIVVLIRLFALSLIFPMVISLVVAVTLIPMLAARVLGGKRAKTRKRRVLSGDSLWVRLNPWRQPGRPARNFLREFIFFCSKGAIRHPIRLSAGLAAVFLLTMAVAGIKIAIQAGQMRNRTETVALYGKPPIGSTLEEADAFFAEKESQLREKLKNTEVFESFDSNFTKEGGQINLKVAEKYQRRHRQEFYAAFEELASGDASSGFRFYPFPTLNANAPPSMEAMAYYGGGAESIYVTGENWTAMQSSADLVKEAMKKFPEAQNVNVVAMIGDPEVQYRPNLTMYKTLGANPEALSVFFMARDKGGVATNLTLRDGEIDRRVTIQVHAEEEEKKEETRGQTLGELKTLPLPLAGGGEAPLDTLGTFSIVHSIPFIIKENRQRHLEVQFSFTKAFYRPGSEKRRQDLLRKIQQDLSQLKLSSGVSASVKGTLEEVEDQGIVWKRMTKIAVVCILLVMAFFFESLAMPLIIFWNLPLACIGGVWAIVLFRTNLDAVGMAGVLVLAGLVVNNGILLIDYTRQMEGRGWRRQRALMGAVAHRFRPILMTSLTTILGLAPILLAKNTAAEARSLVSIVIGGIVAASFSSLAVIPAFYNVYCVWGERLRAAKSRVAASLRQSFAEKKRVRAAGGALRAVIGKAPAVHIAESDRRGANDLEIIIDNVTKIYPLFYKRKLLHFLPSRSHVYGQRPRRGVKALNHVSLEIGPGMFGLLGPNGAGKTTLMQILSGLIQPTFGRVLLGGYDLRDYPQGVRPFISYLPQHFGVYGVLTVEQYLAFFAAHNGITDPKERRAKIDEALEMTGLSEAREKPMKEFSGGMRQRAGIAQLLMKPCPIMIVDEPTAGLDPVERVRFRLVLSRLAQTRIIILSTHIVDDVTSSCKRVAVLNQGQVIYQGNMDEAKGRADGLVWNVVLPENETPPLSNRAILYKKHLGDRILYHYLADTPHPCSMPAEPTFEDAYVALLLRHSGGLGGGAGEAGILPEIAPVGAV